jgi:thiaminase (transcriptional activator TenA)
VNGEASICDEMRARADGIWRALHDHPFLRELSAGTLPLEKFRFFLEQDDLYLAGYARCLAMGAAKARDEAELRYFTVDLNQVLDLELPSNRELLARVIAMGAADRGGGSGMAPANVAYTSYLESLAFRGGPIEIMAALLPCAWSYVEIAQRLADGGPPANDVFADWISYFTLPATVEMVTSMRRDLDRRALGEGLGVSGRGRLGEIFTTSSRLEWGFWEMAYSLERWPDAGAELP